jgi:hypothetical protein
MDGTPVWLASISKRHPITRQMVPNTRWSPTDRVGATALLTAALSGVGDPTRQRTFRMNVTYCVHRALTDTEISGLPQTWHAQPGTHLAGGPVEILHETVRGGPSTRPCEAPSRSYVTLGDPDMWIPRDCGRCGPCLARRAVEVLAS